MSDNSQFIGITGKQSFVLGVENIYWMNPIAILLEESSS